MMDEPKIKRRKVVLSDDVIEDVNTCLIEKLISDMKESTNNLIPILANDVISTMPLTSMYSATVLDKKLIYKIIVQLNEILPLTEFQFLKRVRDRDILLCPVNNMTEVEIRNYFNLNNFTFIDYFIDEIKIVEVVSKAPISKIQFEAAIKYWPCNFHPNKQLELQLSGNCFDEQEIKRHRKYMKLAYEIAEMYEDNLDLINSNNEESTESVDKDFMDDKSRHFDLIEDKETVKKKLKDLKGVVVVDPSIDSIVAVGYDRRQHNPCQHPVMVAIDNVAKSQHGGAWSDDSMFAEVSSIEKADLVLKGVPKMFRNILNATYTDLKFGAKPTKKREFSSGVIPILNDEMEDEKHVTVNKRDSMDSEQPSGPYLCTGYDVYTTNEPCLMCCMGLVHSRARRVFYGIDNEDNGALNSTCKLHTVPYLNHHFEVFTGFFDL